MHMHLGVRNAIIGALILASCAGAPACRRSTPTTKQDPSAGSSSGTVQQRATVPEPVTWREDRYVLRMDFLAEVGVAPGTRIHVEGTLRVSELHGTPTRKRFVLADGKALATQGGQETWKPTAAEIATPFYVEYDAVGIAKHILLAPDTTVQIRRTLDTLASELQFPATMNGASKVERLETDNIGTYTAVYDQSSTGWLTRRRTSYTTAANEASAGVEIIRSSAQLELSSSGQLLSLKSNNVVALRQLQVRSGAAFEIGQRIVFQPNSLGTPPSPPSNYQRFAVGQASAHSDRERDEALTAGWSWGKLLLELQGDGAAPQKAEVRQRLAALIRLDGTITSKIVEAVRNRSDIAKDAVGALVLAGTPQAQQGLEDIITDASLSTDIREHAAIFSAQVNRPTEALLLTVFGEFNQQESAIREVAGLASGTLIAALQETPTARRLTNELQDRLASSQGAEERYLLLGILGNAGVESTAPTIFAAAKSDSELERAQAVRCLRNIDTEDSRRTVRRALRDRSPQVRLSALESIRKFKDPEATPALVAAVRRETHERVQLQLLNELATRRTTSGVPAILDWAARSAKSSRVRAFAEKIQSAGPAPAGAVADGT